MSYSFSVKAATKAEAIDAVVQRMGDVVAGQPDHAKERAAVEMAAAAFVNVLADDPERDVSVSVNGSLSWTSTEEPHSYYGASMSISAGLQQRAAAPAA